MTRKELQNLFPPVPGHFLDRIDRTMEEIEAMNTNSIKRIRRVSRPVLIAAIVFALTAATALAAVLGHHALKDALNASGLEDVAEQVTDIQATDASDGFCLTLDEAVWEGEKLYLSCTVAVPEDGNTYLYSLMLPTLNGEHASSNLAIYFDQPFGPFVYPIGGAFPTQATLILPLESDSSMLSGGPVELGLRADFYTTNRKLAPIPDEEDMDEYLDATRDALVYKSSDVLYYAEGSNPGIQLTAYREVADMDWQGNVDGWLSSGAEPEKIAATGLIDLLSTRELQVPLSKDMLSGTVMNNLDVRDFTWKDVAFTVERFRMTHFSMELVLHAEQNGIAMDNASWDDRDDAELQFPERLHNARFELVNGDGSPLMDIYGETCTDCRISDAPTGGYTVKITAEALFPDEPRPFILLPQYWVSVENEDYEKELVSDTDDPIVTLTPVYSEEVHETELEEQERFEAIRDWKQGDAAQTVYATEQGSYYHYKPDCSGMMGSKAVSIEDALAAGKPACPVCIGGPNSRVSTANDIEVSDP